MVGRYFLHVHVGRVCWIGEFKYATRIFHGANDIAMATKFRQKFKKKIAIIRS